MDENSEIIMLVDKMDLTDPNCDFLAESGICAEDKIVAKLKSKMEEHPDGFGFTIKSDRHHWLVDKVKELGWVISDITIPSYSTIIVKHRPKVIDIFTKKDTNDKKIKKMYLVGPGIKDLVAEDFSNSQEIDTLAVILAPNIETLDKIVEEM
jgi:hypothetical protein